MQAGNDGVAAREATGIDLCTIVSIEYCHRVLRVAALRTATDIYQYLTRSILAIALLLHAGRDNTALGVGTVVEYDGFVGCHLTACACGSGHADGVVTRCITEVHKVWTGAGSGRRHRRCTEIPGVSVATTEIIG